jgi:hypothetical protein
VVGLRTFSQPSSRVSISFSNCWRSGPPALLRRNWPISV